MLIFRHRGLFPLYRGEDKPLAVEELLLAVWKIFLCLLAIEKQATWFMSDIGE
jgi:hypothetical protein|tara:strand:- start:610 stop:768 length:159 start_codon:yes stop_codon:yes gene_type:complete